MSKPSGQDMPVSVEGERNEEVSEPVTNISYDWEILISPDGSYSYVSPGCELITGCSADEFIENPNLILDIIHPEDRGIFDDHQCSSMDSQCSPAEMEFRVIDKKGEVRWIWHKCHSVFSSDGQWEGRRTINREFTLQKMAEEKLRQEQQLFNDGPTVVFKWKAADGWPVEYVSANIKKVLGYDPADLLEGRIAYIDIIHPDDVERVSGQVLLYSRSKKNNFCQEYRVVGADGTVHWVFDQTSTLRDSNGKITYYHGYVLDISKQKYTERQLLLLDKIFANTLEGIAITDSDGRIQKMNPAGLSITGYEQSDLVGKYMSILKSDIHPAEFHEERWESLKKTGSWNGDIWSRRKNGEICPLQMHMTSLGSKKERLYSVIYSFHDMTEVKSQAKEIQFQTYHDALTGLPNRTLFLDRLKVALRHAKEQGSKLAIIVVDIDDFRLLNDSLGHKTGDLLLQKAALRIKECVRENDTVARQGSDDFIVLLENLTDIEIAAETAQRIAENFRIPFIIDKQEYFFTISAGVAEAPEDGETANALLSNADLAMYRAKKEGKNAYCIFTKELNEQMKRRFDLSTRLRNALENEEFVVYYQPKMDIKERRMVGVEALVRWEPEPGNVIPPFEFIPLAEATGLIVPLGKYILRTSCLQAVEWKSQGHSLNMAVNLSPRQFAQEDFLESVTDALQESGLPASMLELEITETLMMENEDLAISQLWELKKMGIKISIDDFGTGYSSLAYLKQLPIDILKIDRSFVKNLPDDQDDVVLTSTIINMAKNLGLNIVAEGVETIEQLQYMCEHGCELIQGYYFSPPVSASHLEGLLNTPIDELFEGFSCGNSCCSGVLITQIKE